MGQKIRGEVVRGNRVGRKLGFPTANVVVDESLELRDGVYVVRVWLDGREMGGVANLGHKPSVESDARRMLEVHILDLEGEIYGRQIEVELLEFIRPERKFSSLDKLRDQIADDKRVAEEFFRK